MCSVSSLPLVDNEETALLHEEATMTIEELLVRYGQNLNKSAKKPGQDTAKELEDRGNAHTDKGINGETECGASETDSNGKAKSEETAGGSKMRACRRAAASCGGSSADGDSSKGEKAGATADAGPSCSSSSAAPTPGSAKSKFFEDSDESDEGEDEEEGSDEEVRRRVCLIGCINGVCVI